MGIRLDIWLTENNFFSSRERARRAIESGCVNVNGIVQIKPSYQVQKDDEIHAADPLNYVSAGGLKLGKAIQAFNLDLKEKLILDIGASTGGFTDCALQHGAARVYAVDVGTSQMHPALLTNPLVSSIENQDFRTLTPAMVGYSQFDFILIDVSFISLKLIFIYVQNFLATNGKVICLIKPQFEAGKERIGKGGIVKDRITHHFLLKNLFESMKNCQLYAEALCFAPLVKNKNIEYLCLAGRNPSNLPDFLSIVDEAFSSYPK